MKENKKYQIIIYWNVIQITRIIKHCLDYTKTHKHVKTQQVLQILMTKILLYKINNYQNW